MNVQQRLENVQIVMEDMRKTQMDIVSNVEKDIIRKTKITNVHNVQQEVSQHKSDQHRAQNALD